MGDIIFYGGVALVVGVIFGGILLLDYIGRRDV